MKSEIIEYLIADELALESADLDADALAGADHGLELVGGAGGDLPAAVHDDDPAAQLLDLLHVVARVDDGGAALVEAPDALNIEDRKSVV